MQIKDIDIGRNILGNIGERIKDIIEGDKIVIVTDDTVKNLYGKETEESIKKAGFLVEVFSISPGENSKNGENYLRLLNFLASIPLTRADGIVALGGGVVGDLAGFAAATYLRGIKIVQVPTTLLAAVDSSVGGKTAINLEQGKNLAGAFHKPALVYCDVEVLGTLSEDVFIDGMAEVIKYGIIRDRELFDELKSLERKNLEKVIATCIKIKSDIVDIDEKDTGIRQILNFGHTIGHAIEKASNYEISHGMAVAKGMKAMAEISEKMGWCSHDTVEEINHILFLYGFDTSIKYEKKTLYDIMKADKKRRGGYIDLVVADQIGSCRLEKVTIEELGKML